MLGRRSASDWERRNSIEVVGAMTGSKEEGRDEEGLSDATDEAVDCEFYSASNVEVVGDNVSAVTVLSGVPLVSPTVAVGVFCDKADEVVAVISLSDATGDVGDCEFFSVSDVVFGDNAFL